MKKRLLSLVLALSMVLLAVPGMGTITTAAADTKIVEFDAASIGAACTAAGKDGEQINFLKPLGLTLNGDAIFAYDNAIKSRDETLNKVALVNNVKASKTNVRAATYDFTADTSINPSPAAMDGDGLYRLEVDFVNTIVRTGASVTYILRGNNNREVARILFDQASGTVSLRDAEGTLLGTARTVSMNKAAGYLRLDVDMKRKTLSAYVMQYASAAAVGTVPAMTGDMLLAKDLSFLDTLAKSVDALEIMVNGPGSGNLYSGIYNLKATKLDDAAVSPGTATFDKNAAEDLAFTLSSTHDLYALKLDGAALTADVDYTVAGNVYTVKKETLSALDTTSHTLLFDMDSGADPDVVVTVKDSSVSADATYTVTATSADGTMGSVAVTTGEGPFKAETDVTVKATAEAGHRFTGWTAAGIHLTPQQAVQAELTFSMPQANVTLTAQFKLEENASLTETALTYDKNPASEEYGILQTTLNPGDFTFLALKNGTDELVEYQDYTRDGNQFNLQVNYLDTLNGHVILTFEMDGGTNPTLELVLTIKDTRAPETGQIFKLDADALLRMYNNRPVSQQGDSGSTFIARRGVSYSNCYTGSAISSDPLYTLGLPAVRYGFNSSIKTDAERGGFDLTQTSDLNPAPVKAMDGEGTYMVEVAALNYLSAGGNDSTCYGRYELRGTVGAETKTIARLKFSRAAQKISLVDTSDAEIGSAVEATFGNDKVEPAYVRFVVDMKNKKYSAYLAKYAGASEVGTVPADLTVLAENQAFLNGDVAQLTRLDVSGRFEGGGTAMLGFAEIKAKDVAAASLDKTTADYDVYTGGTLDVTLTQGTFPLKAVKLNGTALAATTDYTVAGSTYTIKEDTLKTMAAGERKLTFDMESGNDPEVTITVTDSSPTPKYTVTPSSSNAEMGTAAVTTVGESFEAGTSVTVTATPTEGNKFTGWTATGITLTNEQKTQNPLTIEMPASNVTLEAAFAAVVNASVSPDTASYKLGQGGTLAFTLTMGDASAVSAVKLDGAALTAPADYTVNGTEYTLTNAKLEALGRGKHTLVFDVDTGTDPSVVISVKDGNIVLFDAAGLRTLYDASGGDNQGTFLANYGISVLGSPMCYNTNDALHAETERTANKMAITYDMRNVASLSRAGGFDFTADTAVNPSPDAMDGDYVYRLETDVAMYMKKADTSAKAQLILRGKKGGETVDLAKIEFDRKTNTVYLVNGSGAKVGTPYSLTFNPMNPAYLRADVNLKAKTISVWMATYASVDNVGTTPALEAGNLIVKNAALLDTAATQLTGMDVYVASPGTGVQSHGFYSLHITKQDPPATYTVTATSADDAKGAAAVTTTGGPFEAGTSVTVTATPTAGNKFTGWTATGITLSEQQQTQNPLTIEMPASDVTLEAAFAAKTNASISPAMVEYNKYSEHANHKDAVVTLTPGDYTFVALKKGNEPLTLGTDYTVDGNTYTIKMSYMENIFPSGGGYVGLTFEMSGGTKPSLMINISDDTPTPPTTYTVTATSADDAKGSAAVTTTGGPFEAGTSVTVTATPTAGNKFTGWTATGITLTSEQQKQNPLTIEMPASDVTLEAAFAAKTDASINPTTANYDKYTSHANHKDIAVTLTAGDYTFAALKNGNTVLEAGTHYTLAGNVYTIKTSYLDTLANGPQTLTFDMDGGTDPTLTVTVANSTPTPPTTYTVTATSADDAKGAAAVTTTGGPFEAGTSVTVTATPTAGNKFTGWTATGITLTSEQQKQNPLTITMPGENVTLEAAFTAKTNASINPTTANYDKYTSHANHKDIAVTLTAGDYTFAALKNGNTVLEAGTHYTLAGNVYTIKTSYLDTLANGPQTLTFDMDGGTDPTLTVTVANSTPTPPTTYTVTASSQDNARGTAAVTTEGGPFEAGTSVTVTATPTAGNKFIGWAYTGVSLTDEQIHQNPLTIEMPASDVTLAAAFAAKTNASLNIGMAKYDKYASHENHTDIVATLNPGNYTFVALKNDSTVLEAGTHYTVAGNVYTIKTAYLDTLATGQQSLTFDMDGGTDPTLTVSVANSTPTPPTTYTVTASSSDDAKGAAAVTTTGGPFEAGTSVTVTATPTAGNKFTGWTATGITLTSEQQKQNPLTITMPGENVTLEAAFAAKVNASLSFSMAKYDKYASHANHIDIVVTLDSGDYTFVALKNGSTTLEAGTHYTVAGNVYTIKTAYLDTLATGQQSLTFDMDGGADPRLTVAVADSTPAPPTKYTVTAASSEGAKGTATVTTTGGPFEAGTEVTVTATPTEGNKFTGWTAAGITLTNEQQKQNPLTFTMPASNVTLTAAFAAKVDATITPATADYDLNPAGANHRDIQVTLDSGDYALRIIMWLSVPPIELGRNNYSVEGNTVTIKTSFLDTLEPGEAVLQFDMGGDVNPIITVNVTDTTPTQTAHRVTVSAGTGGSARVSGSKTEFLPGEKVTVTASANSGYTFGSWSASGVTLNTSGATATFTMPDRDVTVYASFSKQQTSGGRGPDRGSSGSSGAVVVPSGGGNTGGGNNGGTQQPTVDHLTSNYFSDVSTESTWAYGYIEHLAAAGIISGDQNKNFNPKTNISREEFLKMLMEALDIDVDNAVIDGSFADVAADEWYAKYIYAAKAAGLVNGNGDGVFGTGQTITREDMAVMASRALAAAGKTLTQTQEAALTDLAQVSDYAQSSVQQLAAAGVISGDENASFRPGDSALREEAAKIIYMMWKA